MAHGGMSMTIKATSSPTMNTIRMRPKKLHSVCFISKVLETTVKKDYSVVSIKNLGLNFPQKSLLNDLVYFKF